MALVIINVSNVIETFLLWYFRLFEPCNPQTVPAATTTTLSLHTFTLFVCWCGASDTLSGIPNHLALSGRNLALIDPSNGSRINADWSIMFPSEKGENIIKSLIFSISLNAWLCSVYWPVVENTLKKLEVCRHARSWKVFIKIFITCKFSVWIKHSHIWQQLHSCKAERPWAIWIRKTWENFQKRHVSLSSSAGHSPIRETFCFVLSHHNCKLEILEKI